MQDTKTIASIATPELLEYINNFAKSMQTIDNFTTRHGANQSKRLNYILKLTDQNVIVAVSISLSTVLICLVPDDIASIHFISGNTYITDDVVRELTNWYKIKKANRNSKSIPNGQLYLQECPSFIDKVEC